MTQTEYWKELAKASFMAGMNREADFHRNPTFIDWYSDYLKSHPIPQDNHEWPTDEYIKSVAGELSFIDHCQFGGFICGATWMRNHIQSKFDPLITEHTIDSEIDESSKSSPKVCCEDCGLEYGSDSWIEAIIPDNVWKKISTTHDFGGILCITCINKRLAENGFDKIPVWLCGMEKLIAIQGDPSDNLQLLRNFDLDANPKEWLRIINNFPITDKDGNPVDWDERWIPWDGKHFLPENEDFEIKLENGEVHWFYADDWDFDVAKIRYFRTLRKTKQNERIN